MKCLIFCCIYFHVCLHILVWSNHSKTNVWPFVCVVSCLALSSRFSSFHSVWFDKIYFSPHGVWLNKI